KRSGFMGVQIGEGERGVAVQGFVPGGTAEAAGLRAGDVITAIDSRPVVGVAQFVAAVGKLRAGDRVKIEFARDGANQVSEVDIKPRPLESAPDIETKYLAVEVDGTLRRAIVTLPKGGGRYPAVLYITGIGCFSQESIGILSTEAKLLYGLS